MIWIKSKKTACHGDYLEIEDHIATKILQNKITKYT